MKSHIFYLWILILTLGILEGYSVVRFHFSGEDAMKHQITKLNHQIEREKLRAVLADQQLRDLKQTVAVVLPKGKKNYQQRLLASVVTAPDEAQLSLERAATLFEKGKTKFRSTDFEESNEIFTSIIKKYPSSIHVVESYFLLAEGKYQTGEFEECLDTIDIMIDLFPEHELAGFALLRMGQIFATRDRIEDAEQVYRLIMKNFDNTTLRKQAEILLKEITL